MASCHNPDACAHTKLHGKKGGSVALAERDNDATATPTTRIALIGSPNAGKTSVFNKLTGLNAKTGNYPGITVTHTEGHVSPNVILEDLPGTYSLDPISPDEKVVTDLLAGNLAGVPSPQAILIVVDSTTLHRSLNLVAQALSLGLPAALVLTMTDELDKLSGSIDIDALSAGLGIPVVGVIGNRKKGFTELRKLVEDPTSWPTPIVAPPAEPGPERESWTHSMLALSHYEAPQENTTTSKVDKVLLHPVFGTLFFFLIMFLFFQVIFTVAAPFQGWIEDFFAWLGDLSADHITNPLLASFVNNALIGGVGGVLVFVPQILLLFLLISLMDNIGYMSRAAYLMDRVMASAGLEGRAFVALLSSVACAVPGIMATRTMPSSKDRIATIMAAPLMTCSARLPVYLLLVGMLVDPNKHAGPFSIQGIVLFGLYVLGGASAMLAAWVFKHTNLKSEHVPFYMEMPPYRLPTGKTVLSDMWKSTKIFLSKVGRIILVSTIIVWGLMNFPSQQKVIDEQHLDDVQAVEYTTDHSVAASIGKAVEPIFSPLGFDWRITIGLIGSLAAREVFVATMGQTAAAQDPDNPTDALQKMTFTEGPHKGEKVFTTPTIVALLIFFAYALQCMSTVGAIRSETNSWKWPLIALTYSLVLAWVLAYAARWITIGIMAI